jgi:hypothetical protein
MPEQIPSNPALDSWYKERVWWMQSIMKFFPPGGMEEVAKNI